ncbi:MAG: bifunctional nuclease family protein [Armatimonadota bacterium]|nr:bifunctional nuclease family protein [Armatimonadota bacterium]
MIVEGVGFDHLRQTVVVLKDWEGRKLLPIWIGASEAKAIALELEGAKPPRPLSHDLLVDCLRHIRGRITRVVINDLQDSTFYATIDIDTPQGLKHIDSRPSDAIALAVRVKCPVFVDGGALDALIEMGDLMPGVEVAEAESPVEPDAAAEEILPMPSAKSEADDEEIDRFKRLVGDLDL